MPTFSSKPTGTSYELPPQGTFLARCYQFIHIGTVEDTYMGEVKKFNKIRLSFELPTKTKVFKEGESAKPITVHQEYTLSMGSKANLRKIVEGIIGTTLKDEEAYAFDVESLVGKPCLLTIKHKTSASGKVRAEISSVTELMEGQVCPDQVNPSKILSFSNFDQVLFETLPNFIKDKIKTSEQYNNKFVSSISEEDKAKIKAMRDAHNKSFEKAVDDFNDINPEDIPF